MKNNISIDTTSVNKLKKHAKRIKKQKNVTHSEALDLVAKELGYGFENWHHLIVSNKNIRPAEEAFNKGCVVGFDIKDGLDIVSDELLIQDSLLEFAGEKHIFDACCNTINPDDPKERTFKESLSPEDLEEYFREDYSFWYFRLSEKALEQYPTIKKMLNFVLEYSYFPPMICFIDGKQIDVFKTIEEDENVNIEPVNQSGDSPCSHLGQGEYATILISIPDRLMPKNLQGTDHFWKGHGALQTVSVSPTGRLTNKQLMIESIELANRFSVYLKEKFKDRSYGNECKIKVTVVSCQSLELH
jgi:hypothetical protein